MADGAIISSEGPSEANIRRVCIFMVIFAIILITIMLIVCSYVTYPSAAGAVAVVGASLIFGGTGVPMKSPSLASLQVDPFVFALYNSIGISVVTIPLIVYLLAVGKFRFEPWAIVGATDIFVIGYFAFMAVQKLGYCKAPAIWAGVGMTCAFIWGALAFDEKISSVGMAASAIVLLVIGVYCVSTSQAKVSVDVTPAICAELGLVPAESVRVHDEEAQAENKAKGPQPIVKLDESVQEDLELACFEALLEVPMTTMDVDKYSSLAKKKESLSSRTIATKGPVNHLRRSSAGGVGGSTMSNMMNMNINMNRRMSGIVPMQQVRQGSVPIPLSNKGKDSQRLQQQQTSGGGGAAEAKEPDVEATPGQCDAGASAGAVTVSESTAPRGIWRVIETLEAYILCFIVGFCDGTLLVPFKLSEQAGKGDDLVNVFQYIASFGISSLMVSLFLFGCYFQIQKCRLGKGPDLHVQAAMLPGVSSGVLWAAANFMSVHATFYLGIKIGFPLTQTCVLFAAMWGILYFQEFDLKKSGYLTRFSFGIAAIIAGAYLLGASG